jgi:ubiquitin-activating enzyme E1-like protein 2
VRVFCDFGDDFEVSDPTGEEPKEIFIQSITQV